MYLLVPKTPALVANNLGQGKSIHFYFFPGTSFFYGYTANSTGHRGSGGRASQWTLLGLLYNLTTGAAQIYLIVDYGASQLVTLYGRTSIMHSARVR